MGFLRDFTHYCTESLRNFTVVLRWCSNLQDSRLFDRAGCDSNKMDNFLEEKKFWAKKLQKNGFLDFSHITALNRFAILVSCSDHAQTYRMVAYLIAQGAPVIKWTTFLEEKNFSAKKLQKIGFFGDFTHYCTKSLRNFTYCSDDAQTYRIVAPFSLKGDWTKIEPQNNSQLLFTISEISRVSWSWFSLCEILAHFPLSYSCFNASLALKLTR